MNKYLIFIGITWSFFGFSSCNKSQNNSLSTIPYEKPLIEESIDNFESPRIENKGLTTFIPKGHIVVEEIYGDLNKDGVEDIVLLIKATDKSNIVQDEYRGELDSNRRGLIILLNNNGNYRKLSRMWIVFLPRTRTAEYILRPICRFT